MKKPAANLKNSGKWLWIAVDVGFRKEKLTHGAGNKRLSYRLLPRAPEAKDNMPRGLPEIKDTLAARVRPGSFLVFDGWVATRSAVRQLGYDCAPPVIHETAYRDVKTGFHTNDVESENARLKGWSRKRYGRLNITVEEMDEYVFYVNVGGQMRDVMRGLAYSNGGVMRNACL